MTTQTISLVIADDHPVVLQGLATLLGQQNGFKLIESCANGAECLAAIRRYSPDLALLDIAIDPDTDRYAWTSTLRLAERFQLTLYDAAYLELAQRRSLPLASLDMTLCSAARGVGVDLVATPE